MRKAPYAAISMGITLAVVAMTAASAQTAVSYDELAKSEAAANAETGKRVAPLKSIGNPGDEVSPEMQAMIGAPYPPHFNADPKNAAEWKELIDRRATQGRPDKSEVSRRVAAPLDVSPADMKHDIGALPAQRSG